MLAWSGSAYAETVVGNGMPGDQVSPVLAKTTSGLVVAWQDSRIDARGWGIGIQRFTSNLVQVGSVQRVNNQAFENQQNPAVASFSDGKVIVVWQSGRRGQQDVMMRQLQADGSWARSESYANTFRQGDQCDPSVAVLRDQTYLVVWTSRGQVGSINRGIFGQRFSKEGSRLGSEFRIDSDGGSDAAASRVVAGQDGGFSLFWISNPITGTVGRKLMVRQFASDGVPVGDAAPLTGVSGDVVEFSVDSFGNGHDLLVRHGVSKSVALYSVSGASAVQVRQFPSSGPAEGLSIASGDTKTTCAWTTKRSDGLGKVSYSVAVERSNVAEGQPLKVSSVASVAEVSPSVIHLDPNLSVLAWARMSGNGGFNVVLNSR